MQKVEILLEGPDEEACAGLINDLAYVVTQHYQVRVGNVYCGRAPVKRGFADLQVPGFMNRFLGRDADGRPVYRQEGAGSVSRKEQEGHSKGRAEA